MPIHGENLNSTNLIETATELLDEIATSLVMADFDDPLALKEIHNKIEVLQDHFRSDCPKGIQLIESSIKFLSDVIDGKSMENENTIEKLCELVAELQHVMNDPEKCHDEQPGESPEPERESLPEGEDKIPEQIDAEDSASVDATDPNAFILPDHVDELIFRDFLATTESTLQEIEADILAMESGDKDQLGDLRRRLHTLKGESGVIGLAEVEEICHAIEDFLEIESQPDGWVDVLLYVKDWIEKAFESYAVFQIPMPRANEVIVSMMQQQEAVATDDTASVEEVPQQETAVAASSAEAEEQSSFVLPDHIDEKIFRDFLATTDSSLQEIESVVLELESGGEEQLADLRGRIHSLKGESGVIGLSEVEDVCHGIEDFLQIEPRCDGWVDVLLQTKDWIAKAFESYAGFYMPTPPASEIVRTFMQKAEEGLKNDSGSFEEALASTINEEVQLPADEESVSMLMDFLNEAEEDLLTVDNILLEVETGTQDEEKINRLFRIFHSSKGVAGFLGLPDVISLTHQTETMLSKVREGELLLQNEVLDLCFDATTMLRELLVRVREAVSTGQMLSPHNELPSLLLKLKVCTEGFSPPSTKLPIVSVNDKLGEILQKPPPSVPADVIDKALASQKISGRKLGEELIVSGNVEPKKVSQALRAQQVSQKGEIPTRVHEMIKVDLGRVDSLVELVGELAVVESMIVHYFEYMSRDLKPDSEINLIKSQGTLRQFRKISKDLQDIGLQMRMVPVRSVFQKMARLVRDLSQKQGKNIRLRLNGETTEMDRSMVERISDPLVHLIRNSVDHGIEQPQDRQAADKPKEGTIQLSAFHEGGNIIIEIQDDGRGIDRDAVLQKAIQSGLVNENENLSDKDIFNLLFKPGLSTAKQVSEVSGRGVGMDVVKRNIESLHGRISVSSETGKGSSIQLVLPLTLAIIDGMIIRCGEERHIVPTLSIIESLKPSPEMFSSCAEENEMIHLRGDLIPLVRLNRLLQVEESSNNKNKMMVMVVESCGEKIGLMVDEIQLRQQVVIKTLSTDGGTNPVFSGAAILSDGRVGLIINVEQIRSLMNLGLHRERAHPTVTSQQGDFPGMEPIMGEEGPVANP